MQPKLWKLDEDYGLVLEMYSPEQWFAKSKPRANRENVFLGLQNSSDFYRSYLLWRQETNSNGKHSKDVQRSLLQD